MQIEHAHLLVAPRQRVWDVLMDAGVLARVLPGVEQFELVEEDRFSVRLTLGVASIKGTYTGSVEIVDKDPLSSFKLRGEGKGITGWARGEAHMTLVEEGEGTRVIAKGQAQVGGRIAGVGQRMMEGVAKAMAREFFESIARELEHGPQEQVSQFKFTFRMIVGMVSSFFARLFGRRAAG